MQSFPLSFAQQRLWFLDQLQPSSPTYNLLAAFRLQGTLNMALLQQSFNEIIRRHATLRTTFATVDGQPIQVVSPALTVTVAMVDLQEFPGSEHEAEVQRLVTAEAQRPFN